MRYAGLLLRGDEWRDREYAGLRVAVIAPGRVAARIVPEVARTARAVKVFQEEPDWLLPVSLRALPVPRALGHLAARVHLRLTVADPWLRRRLTPDGRFNTRRPRAASRYYATLQQPHVTLVSWPVYALVPEGIRSAEGIEHHVDCIIVHDSWALAQPHREDSCA